VAVLLKVTLDFDVADGKINIFWFTKLLKKNPPATSRRITIFY